MKRRPLQGLVPATGHLFQILPLNPTLSWKLRGSCAHGQSMERQSKQRCNFTRKWQLCGSLSPYLSHCSRCVSVHPSEPFVFVDRAKPLNPFTFEGQRSSAIYTRVLRGMYKRRHLFQRSKTITLLESLDPWILYSYVRDTSLLFRTDTCIRVLREDNVGTCWSHFYLLKIDFSTSVFQGFSRV